MVDKPAERTSHDIVALVRRLTGIRRVGHGGTLDPFATGLLLIMIGRATRLFDLMAPLDKQYEVYVQFGARSTTGDRDGEIQPAPGRVSAGGLLQVLPRFTGTIRQTVPAYSAVKRDGQPLYKHARQGRMLELPTREVQIHALELRAFDDSGQGAVLSVRCSKGTYIRSLCEDLGAALGTAAYAASLRRTAVGRFPVAQAATPEALAFKQRAELLSGSNPSFLSCFSALYFLPVRHLSATEIRAVRHGQSIEGNEQGPVRLAAGDQLLAVYGPAERAGSIRPLVVLT